MKGAFIYIDAGKGHFVPAKALYDAMLVKGEEAVLEDFFLIFKAPFYRWFFRNIWRFYLHHPNFERFSNKVNDRYWIHGFIRLNRFLPFAYRSFKAWYEREKPDFIITTNFMTAPILVALLERMGVKCPVYDYVSDLFDSVKCSIDNGLRKVYVPTSLGCENVVAMGQKRESVELCPFPLSLKFHGIERKSKREARKLLGLGNMDTILMNLGGEGIGSPAVLYEIARRKLEVQVVVIGGKNRETERRFKEFQKKYPDFPLFMRGFVEDVPLYIMASDLQMGKAGANSLMESLYLSCPFLISEVLYMARSTPLFFSRHRVGWCEDDTIRKVDIIEEYLKNPEERRRVEESMEKLPVSFDTMEFVNMLEEETLGFQKENGKN